MEKKMTAEEIIDKLETIPSDGWRRKDILQAMKEYAKQFTPLPDNNGVKDGFIYLVYDCDRSGVLSVHGTNEEAELEVLKLRKGFAPSVTFDIQKIEYFSPPAKVEVSDEQIYEIVWRWVESDDEDEKSVPDMCNKLRHLLSNK